MGKASSRAVKTWNWCYSTITTMKHVTDTCPPNTPFWRWKGALKTSTTWSKREAVVCISLHAIQGKFLLLVIKTALHIYILDNTSKPLHFLIQIPDILPAATCSVVHICISKYATNRKPLFAGHHCTRSELPKQSQQHTIFYPLCS
jgi:hypothetical protein